jgi:hypothetical protein
MTAELLYYSNTAVAAAAAAAVTLTTTFFSFLEKVKPIVKHNETGICIALEA